MGYMLPVHVPVLMAETHITNHARQDTVWQPTTSPLPYLSKISCSISLTDGNQIGSEIIETFLFVIIISLIIKSFI